VIGCSPPSSSSGRPTISAAGRQSAISRSIAAQSGWLCWAIVASGRAAPVRRSPMAVPMRR